MDEHALSAIFEREGLDPGFSHWVARNAPSINTLVNRMIGGRLYGFARQIEFFLDGLDFVSGGPWAGRFSLPFLPGRAIQRSQSNRLGDIAESGLAQCLENVARELRQLVELSANSGPAARPNACPNAAVSRCGWQRCCQGR